jgi:hypothetical protein
LTGHRECHRYRNTAVGYSETIGSPKYVTQGRENHRKSRYKVLVSYFTGYVTDRRRDKHHLRRLYNSS